MFMKNVVWDYLGLNWSHVVGNLVNLGFHVHKFTVLSKILDYCHYAPLDVMLRTRAY